MDLSITHVHVNTCTIPRPTTNVYVLLICVLPYCRALKVLLKGDLVVLVFYKHINNVLYFIFFKFKIKLLPEFKLNTLSSCLCQVPKWLVICNPSRS